MSKLKEFPAFAGMKTSVSAGRTVTDKAFGTARRGIIDSVWDSDTAYSAGQYVWFPDKKGDIYRAKESTNAAESPDTHAAKWDSVNAEWAGNDRPELHRTFDGRYQTCVEREATARITHSNDIVNWGNPGDNFEVTPDQEPNPYGNPSTRIVKVSGDTIFRPDADSVIFRIFIPSTSGTRFNTSFVSKIDEGGFLACGFTNTGARRWEITIDHEGNVTRNTDNVSNTTGRTIIIKQLSGGWLEVFLRARTTDDSSVDRFILSSSTSATSTAFDGVHGINVSRFMVERSATDEVLYQTLYIPTTTEDVTRPAPVVPIANFLPDTGYAGWVGEMARAATNQTIWQTEGDSPTSLSFLRLTDENEFSTAIYGTDGGALLPVNPFTWVNNDFKTIVAISSWSASTLYLWLCDLEGNLYGYSTAHDINTDTNRQIYVGSTSAGADHSSIRTANIDSGTEVIDTEQKAKAKIEELTTGSYNLKASEITLQNP